MAITSGRIRAISVSSAKGEPKSNVPEAELQADFGIMGDAHAGSGRRQVSLLAVEAIADLRAQGADVSPGDFAENLTVEGLNLSLLTVGHRLRIGDEAELEITQLGKRCHARCRIYDKLDNCIMPKQGLFARVVTGGLIRVGDLILADLQGGNAALAEAAIVTVSDSCARGEREDLSGPVIRKILLDGGLRIVGESVVPDNQEAIARELTRLADERGCELVFTTGGTGLGPRDITPEATASVCDRIVPGLGELMRAEGLKKTGNAVLSRGLAGIRGRTLVINLPGSPRAVRESLSVIMDILPHSLKMMRGGGHNTFPLQR